MYLSRHRTITLERKHEFEILVSALANKEEDLILEDPYINPELSPNVTGVLGKEVRLACHVEDLGNKTVTKNFGHESQIPPFLYHSKVLGTLFCHLCLFI